MRGSMQSAFEPQVDSLPPFSGLIESLEGAENQQPLGRTWCSHVMFVGLGS